MGYFSDKSIDEFIEDYSLDEAPDDYLIDDDLEPENEVIDEMYIEDMYNEFIGDLGANLVWR